MITGIDRPTSGEIMINGAPVHSFNEAQMAAWRGRNLGIVFQFFQLFPTLTILENIILPMFYKERSRYLSVMQHAIAVNGSFFNTQRMVQQYVIDAYLR